jgi:hypothetical protein
MNTLTINLENGSTINYQLIEAGKDKPIAYHAETSQQVIAILENARVTRKRLRVYFGDIATGKCWNDENEIFGHIGLSKGTDAYYPLLVYSEICYGGGTILDHCIIKIKESKGGRILYKAPNFQQSNFEIKEAGEQEKILGFTHSLYIDGTLYSNHKSEASATRLKNKLS